MRHACSALSEQLAEPLAGTAAVARTWLCVEQPGPWGHSALQDSRLDQTVGAELLRRTAETGVRPQLIRRPEARASTPTGSRRVYLAHSVPGQTWVRRADVSDPAEVLDLDFARIALGEHDGWGTSVTESLLLVCTNGRRDRCCALRGRALAGELASRHTSVWETTHTGGHRFAPAAVLLPTGYTFGRLDAPAADSVLTSAQAGKLALESCRGRSCWSPQGQAAELAVRARISETSLDELRVAELTDDVEVVVAHRDGRRWGVTVREQPLDPPRPNSCGKDPVRPKAVVVERVRDLAG